MKKITILFLLVALTAGLASAEVKKKGIKSMSAKQQEQQANNAQATDYTDFDRAMHAFVNDDLSTALNAINRHLKLNPNDAYGWTCLAAIQSERDNDAEALKALKKAKACRIEDNDPETLNWMYFTQSSVCLAAKDTIGAIDALNKAVECMPGDVDSYMRLGNIYKMQREYDLAMVNYGLAVQYKRDEVEGYLGLGTVAGSLGKHQDAIKAFTMAIKFEPDVAESYALRAVEYYNEYENELAAKDVISAFELENDNIRAKWILEYLKRDAMEEIQKVFKDKAKKSKDNSWLKYLE